MPITRPERHNPLMLGYSEQIGLSDERLAHRAGVAYSQVYMSRTRNVGADNAAKISRTVAWILGLSYTDELHLKAEIMGDPGNLVRAYLGSGREAAEKLDEEQRFGRDVVFGRFLSYKAGPRILGKLEALDPPQEVLDMVRATVKPPPSPPGKVTHDLAGEELQEKRREYRERAEKAKPETHRAISASGLSRKELYQRAGIGKETLRLALNDSCGPRTAYLISGVLAEPAGLSGAEQEAVRAELLTDSEEILGNL